MTIDQTQHQIIGEMAALDEWFDKYAYLLDQGKTLEPFEDRFKVEENLIPGCQSSVWVHGEIVAGRMHLQGDSDALITKGMLGLLLRVLNNRAPRDIAEADLFFIRATGLSSNLSPSRANGLAAIVNHIKHLAG